MSHYGKLYNVAKVGVSLLNSFVSQPLAMRKMNYTITLGKKTYKFVGKYVVVHPDPTKEDVVSAGYTLPDDGEISFVIGKEPTGGSGIFVFNNNTTTDYYASFTKTGGLGNTSNPQFVIPHANNPFEPNYVDITDEFLNFPDGNIAITAVEQAPVDEPPATLLSNFGVTSVIATAVYLLYAAKGGEVDYRWLYDASSINGCAVTNSTPYSLQVTVNLTWESPATAFAITFNVPPGSVLKPVTVSTDLPPADRPIDTANVAVSTADISQKTVNEILADAIAKQTADGKLHMMGTKRN